MKDLVLGDMSDDWTILLCRPPMNECGWAALNETMGMHNGVCIEWLVSKVTSSVGLLHQVSLVPGEMGALALLIPVFSYL